MASEKKEPTIDSLEYITREQLADILKAGPPPTLAVVDVRDSDYAGGHIKGSIHTPSQSLDYSLPDLVRKLEDKKTVVFHCMLSQERGPRAALRYARALHAKDVQQQIYVLQGGFVLWQAVYGEDGKLTEGYEKDLWDE